MGAASSDPTNWPLELGETLVVYHPHAKRPPEVMPTRELADVTRRPSSENQELGLFPSGQDPRPPYFPFKTLADFELTELFVKHDHTDGEINDQLDLWNRHAHGTDVTLENAREVHRHLEAAGIEEDISQVKSSKS